MSAQANLILLTHGCLHMGVWGAGVDGTALWNSTLEQHLRVKWPPAQYEPLCETINIYTCSIWA